MLHSGASKITNIHQAVICCMCSDVIWRRGKITNDRTMTKLGRSEYQCQVFSYQMIHNKIAGGRTFLKNKSCDILFLLSSVQDNISSLRCFKLLQDEAFIMLLLTKLKSTEVRRQHYRPLRVICPQYFTSFDTLLDLIY